MDEGLYGMNPSCDWKGKALIHSTTLTNSMNPPHTTYPHTIFSIITLLVFKCKG